MFVGIAMYFPRRLPTRKYFVCNKSFRRSFSKRPSFFITTPIFYANASPHIGHLYTALLADASYRFQHLRNPNETSHSKISVFSTGTDEHGTKIQQAAAAANMTLPNFCSSVSNEYVNLFRVFDIEYTKFIRTSDDKHKAAVQQFWKELESHGHIYLSKYAGWYCVSDESFVAEKQTKINKLSNGTEQRVSLESGRPVEWTEEENFKFRLSNFQSDLLNWLKDENVVKPSKFYKILRDWIEEGHVLEDISVSRPMKRVHWAINVPGNDQQTIYVWLDALVNYLTAVGYPDEKPLIWPPSFHVVGKDILKFHGVYWPAFLMAAGFDPPSSLLVHSHWTVDGEKMSKSAGNVVDPLQKADIYTPSGLRYFLLREGTPHSDANYNDIKAVRYMNAELADTLGNLLSRCTGKQVNPEQKFPAFSHEDYADFYLHNTTELRKRISTLSEEVASHYENFNFYCGIEAIILTLHQVNKFFEESKPWELRKRTDRDSKLFLDCVLCVTMESLRICSIGLLPIVPRLATAILDKLNVSNEERTWKHMSICCYTSFENTSSTQLSKETAIVYKRIAVK